jgi:hypothetical protein
VSATSTSATSEVPGAGEQARGRRRTRRRALMAGVVVTLITAGAVIAVTDPFAGARASGGGVADNSAPASLATVKKGTLSSQVNQSGTLGYAAQRDGSPYTLVNQATGTFSALPSVGQVIKPGQVLYRVADKPVVLLSGRTPVYRALSEGLSGPDVQELNANLVALGYATRAQLDPSSDYFSWETVYALEKLQAKLGVDETGSLALGQAVFLPGALRITKVTATLGTAAGAGTPVAQATSSARQVVVNLDAAQQTSVKVGDRALITLPNHRSTQGVVTSIGTVASTSGGSTTIPIYIGLNDPRVTGNVDQAPVQVQITTAAVHNALIVPVNSLLALAGGGYAVETVDARRVHRLVPVTPGLFDDADGLVQVSGSGLAPSDQIVVPST